MKPLLRNRSGFALVVVLGVVVLLVVLAVGFLMRVAVERQSAGSYHASVSTRELADTAVNLVQAQINLAATQGAGVAWVSQPGMVRTYTTSGTLKQAFKLYSAAEMVSGTVGIALGKSADEPPADWAGHPAIWVDLNAPVESGGVKNFPILDGSSAAEGFALQGVPGATSYQPVPMPLRWLYVLRDGTLVAPSGTGSAASVPGETSANPIVGRVAFWTDDESCKVNINTASEGSFWDVPRAETDQEKRLGEFQPALREFQRYAGHPAMTSLSAVFSSTSGGLSATQIYDIVPKIVGGGSEAGTALATIPLTPDTARLYANVDELIFDPNRVDNAGLDKTQLERARFFLTAHSRAPETNLFNLPRIACWPVFKDLEADRVTAFDRLIAFCASTGAPGNLLPYYFQRQQAASATNDIAITRNTELYGYLQYLTREPIPGFGGSFLAKYGTDRDQILTEIFDYIRSTNLHDDLLAVNKQFTTYWSSTNMNNVPAGHGWVAPTHYQPDGSTEMTMGLGRTFSLSEFGIAFICNADGNDTTHGSNDPSTNAVLSGAALAGGEKYVQAILLPELFAPMLGYIALCPDLVIEISGLDTLTLNGQPLFPVSSADVALNAVYPNIDGARIWGGNPGWRYPLWGKGSPARGNLPADTGAIYPFISTPIKINTSTGNMTMSTGSLEVKFYSKSVSSANLLQTISVSLTGGALPIPTLVNKPIQKAGGPTIAPKESWWTFCRTVGPRNGRLFYAEKEAGAPGAGSFVLSEFDVVRTVLAPHGDFRLAGASWQQPASAFASHPLYSTASTFASNLCSAGTSGDQGFTGGKYVAGLNYNSKWIPDIPSTAAGANTPEATGDYDNAIGRAMDGPLINKPDEGATKRIAGRIPYFDNSGAEYVGGQTFFSPNRQMPSPGMFGSLPTGVKAGIPWRTLLFRPQPSHFGAGSPPDHLWLDLFWMPVVEPYAISDRFSTSGKINLNYQILPFTYIKRSTGLRALFKSEKVTAIPNNKAASYKGGTNPDLFRKDIDADVTLGQFEARFDAGEVFRSASEICDAHIVPVGQAVAGMQAFWTANALTGDNTRERIYTTLYPRLTARSNTYTVHFRVQALRKVPGSAAGTWTEGRDQVAGEYRGSTTIERFINASNPRIPNYAENPSQIPSLDPLDKFYKWRVIQNRQFAP